MYIGGYGSSTSKGTKYNLPLFDASVFLGVFCIIFFIAAIAFIIVAMILGNKRKGRYILLLFMALVATLVPGFSAFFGQFSLGSSSTNGQAGAWHSSSNVVQLGSAGIWFIVLNILLLFTVGGAFTLAINNPPIEQVKEPKKEADKPVIEKEETTQPEPLSSQSYKDLFQRKEELEALIKEERSKVKNFIVFVVPAGICYFAFVILITIATILLIDQKDGYIGCFIASGGCVLLGLVFLLFTLLTIKKNIPIRRKISGYKKEIQQIDNRIK